MDAGPITVSCLHCDGRMAQQDNVVFSESGVTFIMPKAFVCGCGYKTVKASQAIEFIERWDRAKNLKRRRWK